jgi:hypothetical protein
MKINELDEITGTLSKPSKMPGWAYGIPAKECKVGSKLAKIPGTVCHGCYALKGCYVFPNVQAAQYKRLKAIDDPRWTRQWLRKYYAINQNGLDGTIPGISRALITLKKYSPFVC